MHAADLARSLNIPRVLVPQAAGTLSALGMVLADFVRDYSRTILVPSAELEREKLEQEFAALEQRAREEYSAEGFSDDRFVLERSLDMRYSGQGYELPVPMCDDFVKSFHVLHENRYGYADPNRKTEVVNVRLRAVGRTDKPEMPEHEMRGEDSSAAVIGDWRMTFDGVEVAARLMDREKLQAGNAFRGAALIVEYSTTTVVPPDYRCRVDAGENLVLERSE